MTAVEALPATPLAVPDEPVSGGEAVYWALRELGVERVFGISSVHNLPIFEAIDRLGGIAHTSCRHEQAATHAADGYARVTGRLGVVIASTGPGTTNTATGLLEAAFASSPVLLITGQGASSLVGRGKGDTHEFGAQLDLLRTLVPHADMPATRAEVRETVLRVARRILTGRPQPGAVQIPIDFQQAAAVEQPAAPAVPPPALEPAAAALDRAAELLNAAERPLLWVGGGAAPAAELVRLVAERLNAPVFNTPNGLGVLPWEHPNRLGIVSDLPAAWELIRESDAVLAVGTRFRSAQTRAWTAPAPRGLVQLDVDPLAMGVNFPAAVPLVGDVRPGLEGLLERLAAGQDDAFLRRAQTLRDEIEARLREEAGAEYATMVDAVDRRLPRDGVAVFDTTIAGLGAFRRLLPAYEPRTRLFATSGAIGPALPTAVGAALGSGRPVVVIQGDGGLMLSVAELATLAESAAPVVLCIFNDRGYGAIRMLEARDYGERDFATDLRTPDFVLLAESMGVAGRRVADAGALDAVLAEALGSGGPFVVDVDLTAMPTASALAWFRRSSAAPPPVRR
jgi:acetolactate synthase-1/2/3 large subunit